MKFQTDTLNVYVKKLYINNGRLLQDLADSSNRKYQSARRWFIDNHENLKRHDVLPVIMKETGLTYDEIFLPLGTPKDKHKDILLKQQTV